MNRLLNITVLAILGASGIALHGAALAAPVETFLVCSNNTTGTLTVKKKCTARKESRVSNLSALAGPAGPAGATGSTGANGSLAVYGDGSGGSVRIQADQALDETNTQYTDFTIDQNITVTVPSGTVIRCTGNFVNNGTIAVSPYARGGYMVHHVDTSLAMNSFANAGEGASNQAGSNGAVGGATILQGGGEGPGMYLSEARKLLMPGLKGGSGGGYSIGAGGDGGGTLVVLCKGAITNNGVIRALGGDTLSGGGGGGGGIIVLASQTLVTNANGATLNANGGAGGPSTISSGPGGGGGGGVVHMISAAAPQQNGTVTVSGGAHGSAIIQVTATDSVAGGGGGNSGGGGGDGGSIGASRPVSPSSGQAGYDGYAITSTADPTSLM
jgi:hypothetical protein